MPVYFICRKDISGKAIAIASPLAHHLHVLRYQAGDSITLVDEAGKKYETRVAVITSKRVVAHIVKEETRAEEPRVFLRLGVAWIKGERMDGVLEKGVELGASRISPLITRRVIVRYRADRMDHQKKRWEAIAREAAQQSERWEIPPIDQPCALSRFLEETQSYPFKFIFWENEAPASSLRKRLEERRAQTTLRESGSPFSKQVAILIGPEGGWDKEEVAHAQGFGYHSVSLGDRPLRADTAAVAALTLLQYEFQND